MRCDHPSNIKRGGVCIYYRDHLPLSRRSDITCLDECLVCEIKVGNKKCFITLVYRSPTDRLQIVYRSPSQTIDEFCIFKRDWEDTIAKINNTSPYVSLFIGDFNARNSSWWTGDINNSFGLETDEIASHHGLQQIIDGGV